MRRRPIAIIAHRGDSARWPENTLEAFRAAVDAGADGIELDVRLTADGHPVVMHDDDVARTTGASGAISKMTLAEVRALTARMGEATGAVPALEEVLDDVGGTLRLIVEMKAVAGEAEHPSALPVVAATVPMLAGVPSVTVDSFDPNGLDAARALLPGVPCALACVRLEEDWMIDLARERGYETLLLDYRNVDAAFVGRAREAGLEVMAWSVSNPEVPAAAAMGLDGVVVSDPAGARAALDA